MRKFQNIPRLIKLSIKKIYTKKKKLKNNKVHFTNLRLKFNLQITMSKLQALLKRPKVLLKRLKVSLLLSIKFKQEVKVAVGVQEAIVVAEMTYIVIMTAHKLPEASIVVNVEISTEDRKKIRMAL